MITAIHSKMGESVLLGSENLCDVVNGILNLHFPEYKLGSSAIELIPQPDMSDVKYSSFFEASDKKSLAIIEHILAEFVQNAIESYGWEKNDAPDNRGFTQYHPKGGKVTVKVYIGNSSGYGCIIEISDNGSGMSKILLEKVLSEGGSYGKVSGSGLGLKHAKKFSREHNGYFHIESRENAGTTVFLTLPTMQIEAIASKVDAVLIDDDELIQLLWKKSATQKNKTVRVFSSIKDCLSESTTIEKHTPIYVDYALGKECKGDKESEHLHTLGFQNIFLATGYPKEYFQEIPWIKAIVDKDPPF